jgi:hypothetical protein
MNVASSERPFIAGWCWDHIFLGNAYSLAGLPLELFILFNLLIVQLGMPQQLGLKLVVWSILVFLHQGLLDIRRTDLVVYGLGIDSSQIRLQILILSIKREIVDLFFLFSPGRIFDRNIEIRPLRINIIFNSNLAERRLNLLVQLRRRGITILHHNYFIFQRDLVHVLNIVVQRVRMENHNVLIALNGRIWVVNLLLLLFLLVDQIAAHNRLVAWYYFVQIDVCLQRNLNHFVCLVSFHRVDAVWVLL